MIDSMIEDHAKMDMDEARIIKQVKRVIVQELFSDVDNEKCVLDLYLENNEVSQQFSKVTRVFLDSQKKNLMKEHADGKILFFRKYNYEKILIHYLEHKYRIDNVEFELFASDKKERDLEQQKQELREKRIRELEEKKIKQIPYLKWGKTVRVGSIIYASTDESNKKMEFHYNYGNSGKSERNKLLYDGRALKYVKYDAKEIADIIERTHPKNIVAKNIIVIDESNCLTKNKTKSERKFEKQFDSFENTKKQYVSDISKKYGMKEKDVRKGIDSYQNKCRYLSSIIAESCRFQNSACTVLSYNCPYNRQFLELLKNKQRKLSQVESQQASILAKKYNITEYSVKHIERILENECTNYIKGDCVCEQVSIKKCSPQNPNCVLHDEFIARIKEHAEKILRKRNNVQVRSAENKKVNENAQAVQKIGLKDFVVRGSVFKCMHKKHRIDNVDAIINIDDDGKKRQIKISAGYCSQCRIYFILDSTYQNLKRQGMLLCRVTDEKRYMKSESTSEMKLAQESLLMQYGYNVSKAEQLTSVARQKILAVIIDNKIMAKSEIISYLNFFVSQRNAIPNMEIAISKWESDREFVENYRIGEYSQFGVSAIYRR